MIVDHIRYPGQKQDYKAIVLRPKIAFTSPGILLLHDRWGPTPEMESIGERLSHEGYAVMMPDLYQGRLPRDDAEARHLMHTLGYRDGQEEVKRALHWLRNQAYTAAHRTAIVGFEHHGTLGLLAATTRKFPPRAVIIFYAPLKEMLQRAGELQAAIQGHFGEKDEHIPPADVEAFRQALANASVPGELYVYPKVGHDFMRPDREGYDQAVADRAWERMVRFLEQHL